MISLEFVEINRGGLILKSDLFPEQVGYSCSHCIAFHTADMDTLVEHCRTCAFMKRPHDYKFKYVCPLCDYGTYDARPLKAHIFKHAGAKPLKCSLCSFATTYQSSLVSHMRTKHG
uniref:RE1-silencing transcription factor n=1 Tax=Cacopsylla melanoneura TaxID=428564 RepID=A0A8D8SRK9_9HEMI